MPEGEVVEVWPPKTAHLLHHKPSKAQVRRAKASSPPPPTPPPPSSGPSQRPMASSSAPPSSSGVTPPVAPKKSFLRRAVPFLLAANVVVGAYVYLRTNKKETAEGTEVLEEAPAAAAAVSHAVPAVSTDTASPAVSTAAAAQEKAPVIQAAVSVAAATNILPSISENDQRQLFKWILEEKRKVKATSADEKKKIDEEKALLKHYVRLGSIPSL